MRRKFGEIWARGSRNTLAGGLTDGQTDMLVAISRLLTGEVKTTTVDKESYRVSENRCYY